MNKPFSVRLFFVVELFVILILLVSLPTFLELTGGLYESVEDLPLRRFLLEIDIDAPSRQIDALIRDLNEVIRGAG